jgi:hypothetical protein
MIVVQQRFVHFFKDEELRFYLYDIVGPKIILKREHMHYNPLVIYLMNKVRRKLLKTMAHVLMIDSLTDKRCQDANCNSME